MSLSAIEPLLKRHRDFFRELAKSVCFDSRPITAIPSLLFLISSILLIDRILHRRTTNTTPLKTRIFREVGVQCTYFYIVHIWFLFVKSFHFCAVYSENFIRNWYVNGESPRMSADFVYLAAFVVVFCVGLIPFIIILVDVFIKNRIPNFLMWVGEDPWLRSEIGMAGHYLDRPPTFTFPTMKQRPYRSGRSASVEGAFEKDPNESSLRSSKSLDTLKCATEELI